MSGEAIERIECVVEGIKGFSLRTELVTEEGRPYSHVKVEDRESTPGYKPITADNTIYGLVDDKGNVVLKVRFGDCVSVDRGEVVRNVVNRYGNLHYHLKQAGIKHTGDELFETALRTAAGLID